MKYLYGSLACLLGLAASSSVLSEKLYKYQGEDGRWHYTDRMPTADKSAEEIHIKASNEVALFDKVWVREGTGSSPRLTVVNNYHGPIEAYLTVSCKQCEVSPARQVVVPVAATDTAPSMPFSSAARTVQLYCVAAARPVSVKLLPMTGSALVLLALRYTL